MLVQLNLSGEPQKGGCPPDERRRAGRPGRSSSASTSGASWAWRRPARPRTARPGFRRLVALADELGLPVRSIGMSADLEVAVQEGSTMVRIGRDLFGERPPA